MKHRKDISIIFTQLIKYYTECSDIDNLHKQLIIKNLESRKSELEIISVAYDFDMDMFKNLINSGQLKNFMQKI